MLPKFSREVEIIRQIKKMKDFIRVATLYASKAANAATTHNDDDLQIDIMKELTLADDDFADEESELTELSKFNFNL